MGFQFAGFFAQAAPDVLRAALNRWPGCRGRLITEPFHGLGVAVSPYALTYGDSDDEQEQAQVLAWALEDGLVEWSQRYPNVRFVFLIADCAGGTCLYSGYVCQNGAITDRAEPDTDTLSRLVRALGVELDDSAYFAPLARGFFDRSH